jgi:hypothetical protein
MKIIWLTFEEYIANEIRKAVQRNFERTMNIFWGMVSTRTNRFQGFTSLIENNSVH